MGGKHLRDLRETNPERYFSRIISFFIEKYPNASFEYNTFNRNKLETFDPPFDGIIIFKIANYCKRCCYKSWKNCLKSIRKTFTGVDAKAKKFIELRDDD